MLKRFARTFTAALILCILIGGLGLYYLFSGSSAPELERALILYVIDGDTICVQTDTVEGPQKVRLIGVDAPESVAPQTYLDKTGQENTAEGVVVSDFVKELLPVGSTVWLQKDKSDVDRYGRLLRYVWVQEPQDVRSEEEVQSKMLNGILVARGYAQPKEYAPDTAYSSIFQRLSVRGKV